MDFKKGQKMEFKITVPEMGESIVDATITKWLKQAGQKVAAGEAVVELETDKVTLEVPADGAGILARIDHQEGEDVHVGDTLGVISNIETEILTQNDSIKTTPTAPAPTTQAGTSRQY